MKIKSNLILVGMSILAILMGVGELVQIKSLEDRYEKVWAQVTENHRSKIRSGLTQAHVKLKYNYEGKEYEAEILRKERVDDLEGLYILCERNSPENIIDIGKKQKYAIWAIVAGLIVMVLAFCADKLGWEL